MAASGILRRIGIALGVDVDDKEARKDVDALKDFAKKALGTIMVGISLAKVTALANEFSAVNKVVKAATRELGDQRDIQQKILEAANLTRTSYGDTAKVVSSLVQNNADLFGSVDEAVKFNNAATMLFKTAGKTDEEIAGLMESMNKSFAKGAVGLDVIGQMLEQSPEAAALLEKKLGTTKDKLEQMASDGKISLRDLKEAFTDSADTIEERFLESGASINDAMKNIRNQWGLWVSQIWDSAGISQTVGKLMIRAFNSFMRVLNKAQPVITGALTKAMRWLERIADWISRVGSVLGRLIGRIGGVENAIKLLLIAAGAIWLAFNFSKIVKGLIGVKKVLVGIFDPKNLKLMGIALAITAIVLLVEDFVNFMQGNDSVIGAFFDKLGIDSNEVRETIINGLNRVKETIQTVIYTAGKFFSEHRAAFETFGKVLLTLGGAFLTVFAFVKAGMAVFTALGAVIGFLSSPIGLAIAAIAALIAIGVLLYKNWDSIVSYASSLWQSVVEMLENMRAGAAAKVSAIKDAVVNGFQAAISWIRGLPSEALKWGGDVIDGIVDGIRSKIDKVTQAAKDVAGKIKSFLHFSRPDEGPLTDYETWMPDFVGGLARTLRGNRGILAKAVTDVSSALNIRPSIRTSVNSMGSNKAGNVVNQKVEINNTVQTTDAKAGRAAAKQMEKSGDDVTNQITKGLAYGRP